MKVTIFLTVMVGLIAMAMAEIQPGLITDPVEYERIQKIAAKNRAFVHPIFKRQIGGGFGHGGFGRGGFGGGGFGGSPYGGGFGHGGFGRGGFGGGGFGGGPYGGFGGGHGGFGHRGFG